MMSKPIITTLVVASLMLSAQAQTPHSLEVTEHTLSNGLTVWLNEDHSQPKVFGAVVVNAGAKDCPDTGIAHYFEHILFKGTEEIGTVDYSSEKPWLDSISVCYDQLAATSDAEERNRLQRRINQLSQQAGTWAIPNEFSRLISLYGGTGLNAGTSWDFTYYHNSFTPQYIEQWCHLNSDRLINPVFRLFQGELETVYEEKNMYADNMMSTALEAVIKEMFGTQPYAYPIIGSTENLKNPRLSEMRAFYDKYYVARNMGLVLCGDIRPDTLLPLLERTFGKIRAGEKPKRSLSPMPDIAQDRFASIKLPVPIISICADVYKAPTTYEPDANAMQLALSLLYNGKAGLLDSLNNEGAVLQTMAISQSLNDAALCGIITVPNILSKRAKAEAAVHGQIDKLCSGDFSDAALERVRSDALRESQKELETISGRSQKMVEVMASGHRWQEYLQQVESLRGITRDDVVSAANRYLKAPHVHFIKTFGEYPKDKVSQPGYQPVVPSHKGEESAYAKRLRSVPTPASTPRLLDFDHDVTTTSLSPHATLYSVGNTLNDLFELTLSYNRGLMADPRLEVCASLLNQTGTDSLTRQQIGEALHALGADVSFEAGRDHFDIHLTGVDGQMDRAVELLGHLITRAKPTATLLKQLRSATGTEEKSFGKDNMEVLTTLLEKVVYGSSSRSLNRTTKKELKSLTGDALLASIAEVLRHDCVLSYSGTLSADSVAQSIRRHLPYTSADRAFKDYSREISRPTESTVYVYYMPHSRQTLFATYESLPPQPTLDDRARVTLMKDYFGTDMQSVLFQEVREFRSMAYSTGSYLISRSRRLAPNSPLGFCTIVGTQADKSLSALALVDSLLHEMPLSEQNFESSRQSEVNRIYTSFPDFRSIGLDIGQLRQKGYREDSNTGWAEALGRVTLTDIKQFQERHIRDNSSRRCYMVVGDKKKLDLKALERYGKVVVVKSKDIYKK